MEQFNFNRAKSRIKDVVKRFKYFTNTLDYSDKALEVMEIIKKQSEDKSITKRERTILNRFGREQYVAKNLFNVMLINKQPDTLDPKENPDQLTTRQQIIYNITSPSNEDKETIDQGPYTFFTMHKEEYQLYKVIIDELYDYRPDTVESTSDASDSEDTSM